MKIHSILVLLAFVSLVLSAKFNIASTSVCTTTSSTGFCTKWEQNGTVQEQTAACFPQTIMLYTTEGFKTFSQIQVGDFVLGYDVNSGQIFTRITNWFHRDQQVIASYLKINTNNVHSLLVSKKHNIAIDQPKQDNLFSYLLAQEIEKGSNLFGSQFQVNQIQEVESKGMYAPMTTINNYFVYTQKSQAGRVLAHSFANIKNPQKYEFIANTIISVSELLIDSKGQKIHPGAKWMMETFNFMLE